MEEIIADRMHGIIQVAGVLNAAEARMLVAAGVHQIGFPLRLAVHREDTSEYEAAEISRSIQPPASAVLITYLDRANDIVSLCEKLGTTIVQLHSDISLDEVEKVRKLAPQLSIIKSLIVRGDNLAELEAKVDAFHAVVDAFITDTYDPVTRACGATGKTHNWDVSRRLVEISPLPVILAGGLNPRNVRRAIEHVRPAGVDVHTGVERHDGSKDPLLVQSFVREASKAFASYGCYARQTGATP